MQSQPKPVIPRLGEESLTSSSTTGQIGKPIRALVVITQQGFLTPFGMTDMGLSSYDICVIRGFCVSAVIAAQIAFDNRTGSTYMLSTYDFPQNCDRRCGRLCLPLRLAVDILSFPELQAATLSLYDLHEGRLARTGERVKRVVENNKLKAKVEMTTNRRKALKGADYVIVAFQVGGVEAYAHDVEIPRSYGMDQCVGDTLGPGGVFRGLRSIGALSEIARDMLDVCPDALMIQYANPMAMNCWATNAHGHQDCGSVPQRARHQRHAD